MWFDMLSVILLRFCIGSLRSAYLPLAQPPHMFQILCRRGIRRSKYTAERQRRFRQRAGLTNRNFPAPQLRLRRFQFGLQPFGPSGLAEQQFQQFRPAKPFQLFVGHGRPSSPFAVRPVLPCGRQHQFTPALLK